MSERQARQRRRPKDVPEVRTGGFHLPVFRKRAALYVDGFNLFHAVRDLNRNHLKWLDLQTLARVMAPRSQVIRKVTWVSAVRPQAQHKIDRHHAYSGALAARGVTCLNGHFVIYADGCNSCGHHWNVAEEKQSDVNLALSVLDDAHENRFDVCYLMTTDGDHAATARFLKQRFPEKKLVIVTPPGRNPNRTLLEYADAQVLLEVEQLERSLLPAMVDGPDGLIVRPPVYDPPDVPRSKAHLTLISSS